MGGKTTTMGGKYHHVVVHFPSMVVAENTYFPPMVVVFSTGYFNLSELPTTMGGKYHQLVVKSRKIQYFS